jgi:prepilin-type N-terminal cleavage/methylation domain-containing protein
MQIHYSGIVRKISPAASENLKWKKPHVSGVQGFTLVEMLVAMTILALLGVLTAGIMKTTTHVLRSGMNRADNFARARLALSLMQQDVNLGVFRSDLLVFPDNTATQTRFAFWAERQGVLSTSPKEFGDRKLASLEYAVDRSASDELERGLYRGSMGMAATDQLPLVTTPADFPLADPPDTTSQNYELIGLGVVDMRMQFLQRDGSLALKYQYDTSDPDAATNSLALMVSLAVIDKASMNLLKQQNKFSDIEAWLNKPTASEVTAYSYAVQWEQNLKTATPGSFPVSALQSIRFYDRLIMLPDYRD